MLHRRTMLWQPTGHVAKHRQRRVHLVGQLLGKVIDQVAEAVRQIMVVSVKGLDGAGACQGEQTTSNNVAFCGSAIDHALIHIDEIRDGRKEVEVARRQASPEMKAHQQNVQRIAGECNRVGFLVVAHPRQDQASIQPWFHVHAQLLHALDECDIFRSLDQVRRIIPTGADGFQPYASMRRLQFGKGWQYAIVGAMRMRSGKS